MKVVATLPMTRLSLQGSFFIIAAEGFSAGLFHDSPSSCLAFSSGENERQRFLAGCSCAEELHTHPPPT